MDLGTQDYAEWDHGRLVERVADLEQQLRAQNSRHRRPSAARQKASAPSRAFQSSRYSTRLIALRLAYLGQRYNGFEHHANTTTPLPTVEEELWKALRKSRLISPLDENGVEKSGTEIDWAGCEYSKCGRTDKGVSAFGQVIGIRVRSKRPVKRTRLHQPPAAGAVDSSLAELELHDGGETDTAPEAAFDPIHDELCYPQILNRLLPPDIRILAWCPSPPKDFSARFSCVERRYRYFFTQPAFAPIAALDTGARSEGWLDIDAMRHAARHFVGLHDFRNFCKIDASKQINNFQRRISHADIEEVKGLVSCFGMPPGHLTQRHGSSHHRDSSPTLYTFTVHGSAFLWHQVRHMTAILFLIGQGLESPSLVAELLDIERNPTRPAYEMADDAPLVLWDCKFPPSSPSPHCVAPDAPYIPQPAGANGLHWIPVGETKGDGASANMLQMDLWKQWRGRKIDEVLAGSLLDQVVTSYSSTIPSIPPAPAATTTPKKPSQRIFDGNNSPRLAGTYVPVLSKNRLESAEVLNRRYREKRGNEEQGKAQGS